MDQLHRLLDPIRHKIRMMAGRAVLSLMKNVVEIQVELLEGEPKEAELFQQYGFRSKPLPGAEGLQISGNGNRDHTLIFCMDDRRYQINLLAIGECAMYDDLGQHIHLTRAGIVMDGAGLPVIIRNTPTITGDTPNYVMTGSLSVADNITSGGDIAATGNIGAGEEVSDGTGKTMSSMRTAHNTHGHPDPQGGTVGLPTVDM